MSAADRLAIVSGGARGIGLAISRAFLEVGIDVAIVSRSAPPASLRDSAKGSGASLRWFEQDLAEADSESCERLIARIHEAMGRPSVLVNNAGILTVGNAASLSLEDWSRDFRINVTAAFLLSCAVAPLLHKGDHGRVINITSVLGQIGRSGFVSYVASKHALTGLTRALAAEWGPLGTTVNAIAPGDIQSPDGPLRTAVDRCSVGRVGTGRDVASAALWLASPEASFVNGETLVVDGGYLAR